MWLTVFYLLMIAKHPRRYVRHLRRRLRLRWRNWLHQSDPFPDCPSCSAPVGRPHTASCFLPDITHIEPGSIWTGDWPQVQDDEFDTITPLPRDTPVGGSETATGSDLHVPEHDPRTVTGPVER